MWFVGIGIYVMVLGGVFYYNLFKWTFDEKLKQDVLETVKLHTPALRNGLLRNPRFCTMDELDIMQSLGRDDRIIFVLYINKTGIVRWYKEVRFMGVPWDEFQKTIGLPTDAVAQAYVSKTAKVRLVPKQPIYEVAVPITMRSEIIGILDLQVSRAGAAMIIQSAMRKYALGAIGVLCLLGIPLYFFLHHYIVSPIEDLRDSIDSVSTKTLDLKFQKRSDEIGELAVSVNKFLQKVKADVDIMTARDKQRNDSEKTWWGSILSAIVSRGDHAIVVDEDNNVLFTNFHLEMPPEGQKLHLLDVVDSQQQALLRLIGSALETPNQIVIGEGVFKGENCHMKILHMVSGADIRRTLLLFEPKANISV